MHKDFNLFAVYKTSAPRSGGQGVVLLILVFALLVGSVFGTFRGVRYSMQVKIDRIHAELADPEVADIQKQLAVSKEMQAKLNSYLATLTKAEKQFTLSTPINGLLFSRINYCIPEDVKINELQVTAASAEIVCTSSTSIAPAVFTEALLRNGVFRSVTFDTVSRNTEVGGGLSYRFTLHCSFRKAVEK